GPGESGILAAPLIDGFEGNYFEWHGALRVDWGALVSRGTMQAARRPFESLRYGFSRGGDFYLRIDPDRRAGRGGLRGLGRDLVFRVGDDMRRLRLELDGDGNLREALLEGPKGAKTSAGRGVAASAALRKILELSVPCAAVGLVAGGTARLRIRIR